MLIVLYSDTSTTILHDTCIRFRRYVRTATDSLIYIRCRTIHLAVHHNVHQTQFGDQLRAQNTVWRPFACARSLPEQWYTPLNRVLTPSNRVPTPPNRVLIPPDRVLTPPNRRSGTRQRGHNRAPVPTCGHTHTHNKLGGLRS